MSYLIGSIPFGYLIGRFNGLDIRRHGSRNIGATNVRRVLGRDWGVVCFILDFLKGLLPVILFGQFLGAQTAVGVGWGEMFAVAGTIGGHIFPFTLNFKGGKGVATSLGAILAVAFWPVLIELSSGILRLKPGSSPGQHYGGNLAAGCGNIHACVGHGGHPWYKYHPDGHYCRADHRSTQG